MTKKTILLVTCNQEMHNDISESFRFAGYSVISVLPTETLIPDIVNIKPDMIVLDPEYADGDHNLHLCREIKRHVSLSCIPLLLTVDFADDFIVKPVSSEVLLAKAEKYIGKPVVGEKTVLIIDDEKDICKTLSFRLKKSGFNVFSTHTGNDALALIKENVFDLIILDLNLPGIMGEEVCKRIREDERTENIPIIMLTAKASDVDKVIGKVIGANAYVTKPFDIKNLMDEIKLLLE